MWPFGDERVLIPSPCPLSPVAVSACVRGPRIALAVEAWVCLSLVAAGCFALPRVQARALSLALVAGVAVSYAAYFGVSALADGKGCWPAWSWCWTGGDPNCRHRPPAVYYETIPTRN